MNCSPGDLAIIVRGVGSGIAGEISRKMVGKIARVAYLRPPISSTCTSSVVWSFDEPFKFWHEGREYSICGCADEYLRPIRDHDDDARDESHAWLPPVPTKEIA